MENSLDLKISLEKFMAMLNKEPDSKELTKTPDGKAWYLPISFVEMTLDELFFGLWSTENFRWSAIQNEVQASIDLIVIHPITGMKITRSGSASKVITMDKTPDAIKNDNQAKNQWALNIANKKPNALELAFPALKAECITNAARSLGKIFGRDINRPLADVYKPKMTGSGDTVIKLIRRKIEQNETNDAILLLQSSTLPEAQKLELKKLIELSALPA